MKSHLNLGDMFDDLIQEGLSDVYSRMESSIVEFATQKLFNGEDLLYPTQKAVLKLYNREVLDDLEKDLASKWYDDDRTTYTEGRFYQHMVIEGGRRMGKSMLLAVICLYELDKLMSLPDPARHFKLLPGSPIAIFVISQSLEQIKNTLFAGIKGFAEQSNYFKALARKGEIEFLDRVIRCKKKNIGLYAQHTNSKALVGYSIKLLVLDEVSRFEIDEFGNSKADEVWGNVGRAVNTFGKEGRKIAISSAWEPNDKIQQLWNLCKRDISMLGFRFRTWDVNLHPEFTEAVLKASSDYIDDPLKSALEYEGMRIEKQGAFFTRESIKEVTKGDSCVDFNQVPIDRQGQTSLRYYSGLQITRLKPSDLKDMPSFAHIDYGVKKDMAAFACCKPHYFEDREVWGIKVDAIAAWKPYLDPQGRKRIVDFLNCEEIMERICEARRVKLLSFDSFNCLAVGSLVNTPQGLRRIEDLSIGDSVEGTQNTNQVVDTQIKHNVPCITIKTKLGYTLTGTTNHPVMNPQGQWIELKDLKLSDPIRLSDTAKTAKPIKDPKTYKEYRALAMGYLVAEGDWKAYVGKSKKRIQAICFSNTEEETKQDYAKYFELWTGIKPNIYSRRVMTNKREAIDLVESMGVVSGAWNKTTPESIITGTDREIGFYLSGLFEGDGHCGIYKTNTAPQTIAALTTVSQSVAQDVQLLLLKLGIKSSVKHYRYKYPHTFDQDKYYVSIYGQNLNKFQSKVNFRSTRKRTKLEECLSICNKPQRKNRALYLEDKIVSIELSQQSIVHMEVSGDHSYLAQGFVNHNSQASIQRLHTKGIETIEMSTAQQAQAGYYNLLRKLIEQQSIILPMEGFTSVQMEQDLACILQLPNGKITHQVGYKDIPDALANSVWNCNQYLIASGLVTGTTLKLTTIPGTSANKLATNSVLSLRNSRDAMNKIRGITKL